MSTKRVLNMFELCVLIILIISLLLVLQSVFFND